MKELRCIDFSYKGTVLFAAGGEAGEGRVAAVKFCSDMKLIKEYSVPNSGLIQSVRRHDHGNILFLASEGNISVVFLEGANFELIAQYSELPLRNICFMKIVDEELFCISPESQHILKIGYAYSSKLFEKKDRVTMKIEEKLKKQFAGSKVTQEAFEDGVRQVVGAVGSKELLVVCKKEVYTVPKNKDKTLNMQGKSSRGSQ